MKVVFSQSVEEPKETKKCTFCNFRSISPRTREFLNCKRCKNIICDHCYHSDGCHCFYEKN